MTFFVAKSRPFRVFGRSAGKHAAARGTANMLPRPAEPEPKPRRPAHAVSAPRLTGSHASQEKAAPHANQEKAA
jgi:hypothetical protein